MDKLWLLLITILILANFSLFSPIGTCNAKLSRNLSVSSGVNRIKCAYFNMENNFNLTFRLKTSFMVTMNVPVA